MSGSFNPGFIQGGVDSYGQNPLVANPLAPAQNMIAAQGAIQGQQIQSQQFQAQKAVGAAIQQATNLDGSLDTGKAATLISQDPTAAPAANQAIADMYARKVDQMNLTTGQMAQASSRADAISAQMQTLLAQEGTTGQLITPDQVAQHLNILLKNGTLGSGQQAQQAVQGVLSTMPISTAQNPRALHNWAIGQATDAANVHAVIQGNVTGTPATLQAGGQTYSGTNAPYSNAFRPASSTATAPSVADQNAIVSYIDPKTGQPTQGTVAQRQAAMGINPATILHPNGPEPGMGGSAGGGGFPSALMGPGGGGYRPAGAPAQPSTADMAINPTGGPLGAAPAPVAPAAAPAPQAAPAPSPYGQPVASGVNPIQFGAAADQAKASVSQYQDDQTLSAGYGVRANAANHVLQLLDQLGPNATGPGTEGENKIKGVISNYLPSLLGGDALANNVSATELLNKYLTQQTMSMPNAGQSRDALASAYAGSPNVSMQTATIRDATASNLALMKMQQTLFQSYGQTHPNDPNGTGYKSWLATTAPTVDPRAWAVDNMSPSSKAALFKSIGPSGSSGYQKFMTSLQMADGSGLMGQGQ